MKAESRKHITAWFQSERGSDEVGLIFQYDWNGVRMSEKEYADHLEKQYGSSRARAVYDDYDDLYNIQDLMEAIQSFSL